MNKIHLTKVGEHTNPHQLVSNAFTQFSFDARLSQARTVFIKPNLVTDVPEYIQKGANSDIRIIEAVLKALQPFDLRVILGESDTGTEVKGRKLERALKLMGVYALQDTYQFDIVNLTQDDWLKVQIPNGKYLTEIKLAKTFLQSDLIINIPKLKTHKYATITCALKNMFGVIPDPMRIIYHHNIHQVIVDLNSLFWQRMFVVVDGLKAMEGQGPLYGSPIDMNLLMFGDSPLVVDIAAAKIMGFNPQEVKHLALFNQQHGHVNYKNMEYIGKDIEEFRRSFKRAKKNWFVKLEERLMRHPKIVRLIFNDWIRRYMTYHLNPILTKLRGGSYSWYIENDTTK